MSIEPELDVMADLSQQQRELDAWRTHGTIATSAENPNFPRLQPDQSPETLYVLKLIRAQIDGIDDGLV